MEDTVSQPADSATHLLQKEVPLNVPPALLLPTASPHAYVAKIAAETANIDPRAIFSDIADTANAAADATSIIPKSFRRGTFHYFPPAAFGHDLTASQVPEVAFLGRSNVGKSSLVNAIMQRSQLARTSKQPGRTQQVQYYGHVPVNKRKKQDVAVQPEDATAFLVDLPGYGFAAAPAQISDAWQSTTQDWLVDRLEAGTLRRLYLLQDSRHGPQPLDWQVQTWLQEQAVPYTIVFTKADASSRVLQVKWVNQACTRYHEQFSATAGGGGDDADDAEDTRLAMSPIVHVTSSKTGTGLAELWSAMEAEFAVSIVPTTTTTNTNTDTIEGGFDGDVESGDDGDDYCNSFDDDGNDDNDDNAGEDEEESSPR